MKYPNNKVQHIGLVLKIRYDEMPDLKVIVTGSHSAERLKQLLYLRKNVRSYFWSTYTGAEIDYLEEGEEGLMGFEIKMTKKNVKSPRLWKEQYQGGFQLINRGNYLDLLLKGIC